MTTLEEQNAELGFDPEQYNREALCKRLPGLEKALPEWEAVNGVLINGGSTGQTADGRFVLLLQFEKRYGLVFYNPTNSEPTRETNITVSRELMGGLMALYQLLGDCERDVNEFVDCVGKKEAT